MDFLKQHLEGDFWLFMGVSAFLALMILSCLSLAALRSVQAAIVHRRKWQLAKAEELSLEYIVDRKSNMPAGMPKTEAFKTFLSGLSNRMTGDLRLRVLMAYTALGFASSDIAILTKGPLLARIRALKRCRNLTLPLPDYVWEELLQSHSQTLRWATMDYLISIKGRRSMLWLVRFLADTWNQKKGMALHLLSELAERSPEALLALIRHADKPFITRVCLESLSSHPVPGSEPQLIEFAKQAYGSGFFSLALTAVAALPSEASRDFFISLARDQTWEVREQVAKVLGEFGGTQGLATLERLSEDINYKVRYQAVESLVLLDPLGEALLRDIESTPEHPSHTIFRDIIGTKQLARSA